MKYFLRMVNWALRVFGLEVVQKIPHHNTLAFVFQCRDVLESAVCKAWAEKQPTCLIIECTNGTGWALVVPIWETEKGALKYLPKPTRFKACFTTVARRIGQNTQKTLEEADGA